MTGSLRLTHDLTVNPSAMIYGPSYGYIAGDADGNPMVERATAAALINLYLLYSNAFVRGLDIGAGVYNLADQRYDSLEAYTGGHARMPPPGRELVLRVAHERKL